VGLEADDAVGDMDAGVLELAGEDDIALLVEAGAELDEAGDILAGLGGADEALDEG
jgi:hypothetical protein